MTNKLQQACDAFNAEYPVGTPVYLLKDNGDVVETKTRSAAQILSGHSAVIWLEDVSGCYLLERVRPIPLPKSSVIAAFEKAYPHYYWHVAKGKVTAGEPLYGAIITTIYGTEVGHGESAESAEAAFVAAIASAGLELRP